MYFFKDHFRCVVNLSVLNAIISKR